MEDPGISLDEEEEFRPLEQYDKDDLLDKRFQKLNLRLTRMEAMIHKLSVGVMTLLEKEEEIIQGKSEAIASVDDKIDFLDRHEKRLIEQTRLLAEQEKQLKNTILARRKEDAWFNLIMHDCKNKISDKNELICSLIQKPCSFKNCPRKDEVKQFYNGGPKND